MEKEKTTETDLTLNNDGTANFDLNAEGDISGTYRGIFTFKTFLTPLEQLAASRAYRDLIGQHVELATEQERYLAFSLSQLKFRVLKAPPFWKTDSFYDGNINDLNVLSLILDKAISAELLYKDYLKKKKEEALEKAQLAMNALREQANPKTQKEEK